MAKGRLGLQLNRILRVMCPFKDINDRSFVFYESSIVIGTRMLHVDAVAIEH